MYSATIYRKYIIVSDNNISSILDTSSSELYLMPSNTDLLIEELDKAQSITIAEELPSSDFTKYSIEGITVCVAEKCNMNCSYCFAHAGTYDTTNHSVMTAEHFSKLQEKLWQLNPNGIKSIHFFGGDPLLAHNELFTFCENVSDEYMDPKMHACFEKNLHSVIKLANSFKIPQL